MERNTQIIGVLLVGVGIGVLVVRLLPGLIWLWPVGLIIAGLMLWRRLGTPTARWALVAASVTVGLLGSGGLIGGIGGWGAGRVVAQYELEGDEARDWGEVETLVVRNTVGEITVEGGADEVSASVVYRRLGAGGAPDGLQAEYDAVSRTLTVVGVDPELPERARRGLSATIEIEVPEGARLELVNDVGDVSASDLAAADIRIDVGDVGLERVAGDVSVQTDVGELELDDLQGPVEASADVGDISISFDRPVDDPVRATTRVGDVSVDLPSGSDVAIRARSGTRDISGDLEEVTASEGRLQLGDGTHEMVLETDVGEVELERR